MDELIFDTKHKTVLSKEAKYFAYFTGSILIAGGLLGFNSSQFALQIMLLTTGILWIVKAVIGKAFFAPYRYLKMDSDSLEIKFKSNSPDSFQLAEIDDIKLKGTNLILHIRDYVKEYRLSWLSFDQVQELKNRLDKLRSTNGL